MSLGQLGARKAWLGGPRRSSSPSSHNTQKNDGLPGRFNSAGELTRKQLPNEHLTEPFALRHCPLSKYRPLLLTLLSRTHQAFELFHPRASSMQSFPPASGQQAGKPQAKGQGRAEVQLPIHRFGVGPQGSGRGHGKETPSWLQQFWGSGLLRCCLP